MAIRPRKPKRRPGPVGGRKRRVGPVDMPERTKIGKTIKPAYGLPPKRKK